MTVGPKPRTLHGAARLTRADSETMRRRRGLIIRQVYALKDRASRVREPAPAAPHEWDCPCEACVLERG